MHLLRRISALAALSIFFLSPSLVLAQAGTSGPITGSVTDASGAVIPGASVELSNSLTGYHRNVDADATGNFQFCPSIAYELSSSMDMEGLEEKAEAMRIRSNRT